MKVNAKNLGIAGGLIWGFCMFVCTLLSLWTGYAAQFLTAMASIYPGYAITAWGSIVGLIYGFLDGFIGLYLIGWLYNKLNKSA